VIRRSLVTLATIVALAVLVVGGPELLYSPTSRVRTQKGPPSSVPPPSTPPTSTPRDERACNVTDAHVGYTAVFDHQLDEYVVSMATVTFAGSYCRGAQLVVELAGDAGSLNTSEPVEITSPTVEVPFLGSRAPAQDVTAVHLDLEPRSGSAVGGARK